MIPSFFEKFWIPRRGFIINDTFDGFRFSLFYDKKGYYKLYVAVRKHKKHCGKDALSRELILKHLRTKDSNEAIKLSNDFIKNDFFGF